MATITIDDLTETEALAFAQFLKRAGHSDYLPKAENFNEAYDMLFAGAKIRDALAKAGYAPR